VLICRKRCKIHLQWKTNRKSYMAYQMGPLAVTLNDLWPWPWRSFTDCRPFQIQPVEHLCSILYDFNRQLGGSQGSSALAELLVNSWHSGTLALSAERLSARMSEINNVGKTWMAKCNQLTSLRFKGFLIRSEICEDTRTLAQMRG